jgi:hypothetical protein
VYRAIVVEVLGRVLRERCARSRSACRAGAAEVVTLIATGDAFKLRLVRAPVNRRRMSDDGQVGSRSGNRSDDGRAEGASIPRQR